MITIEQIKAARALLSWDQSDLAKAAGISIPALSNLERGAVTPRFKTIEAIQNALENAGIEFLQNFGVTRHKEVLKVDMLEGKDCVKKLFEDIYETLNPTGGDLLASGIDEKYFLPHAGEALFNYLKKAYRHKNMRGRVLLCEGDKHLVGKPDKSIYRWVEKESFSLVPYYIYADKYAIILWGTPTRIIIIQNKALAETHRRQFEKEWKRAKIPPQNIKRLWPYD